ncbi:glycosyltransferase [Mucilaginibacter glaciei]|uniref:Glycosyltransferase n=1 Tax=Mucilaginibacter glaciei TaxID=2772109 RepID=A0A926NU44_9SPHI|nr:glycosyltransferase [Mucilaginibacter glaciei]MBD1394642.1 glycosyltransferase [Mucilaginibacter glaciei]
MLLKQVIIIGPSVERTKGGMASVIQGLTESNADAYGYQLTHYTSHVEGNAIEKLSFFFTCLFKLLFKRNIALVHIHTACDASFYRKAIFASICHKKGVPVIMHIHGADFDTFYSNAHKAIQRIIRRSLKRCNKVIVLSAYWKKFFEETICLNNVVVLFNAVNVDAFKSCSVIPYNIGAFLFLGRLGERKGIYDLVKAIDILVHQENMQHLQFYFAGDGEVDEVKKLITQLNLDQYIDVLGWVGEDQKKEVLLKADTVVLPSYNEGLPVALLEAMAAGKVILSTAVGGIPDLVTEQVNGFLITPGDINSLVTTIKHIYHSPGQMELISKNNVKKIRNEYSSVKINQQLFQLYNDTLLAGNKSLPAQLQNQSQS